MEALRERFGNWKPRRRRRRRKCRRILGSTIELPLLPNQVGSSEAHSTKGNETKHDGFTGHSAALFELGRDGLYSVGFSRNALIHESFFPFPCCYCDPLVLVNDYSFHTDAL